MAKIVCAMLAFRKFASIHFFADIDIVLVGDGDDGDGFIVAISVRVRYCFGCWPLMQNIFDSRIVC